MSQLRRALVYGLPVLLYAGLIFFLSTQSNLPHLPWEGFDKVAHLAEYGMLGVLLARALYAYGISPGRAVLLAIALGALYGISDEFHQHFTPGRSVEVLDAVADAVGSGAGALIWYSVVSQLWGFRC